ncbi:unnamed protein product [Gongylonema pulchrum]|uniref:Integrase catalytic domain-containing protein n=1 Tax=Gongylonema pulchrum TaxID=637853 RepID=A0A183DF51_9BILA|nr:unnamed protein product [Gongylonema pulchrum]
MHHSSHKCDILALEVQKVVQSYGMSVVDSGFNEPRNGRLQQQNQQTASVHASVSLLIREMGHLSMHFRQQLRNVSLSDSPDSP